MKHIYHLPYYLTGALLGALAVRVLNDLWQSVVGTPVPSAVLCDGGEGDPSPTEAWIDEWEDRWIRSAGA